MTSDHRYNPAVRLTASRARVAHSRATTRWIPIELAMMKKAYRMTALSGPHNGSNEKITLSTGAMMMIMCEGLIPAQ